MNFKTLHQQEKPLLLANVWDVPSAHIAEDLGFQAMGTSSAAISALLGYDDGEQMDFDELLFMVKRIAKATSLPFSVDIEAGYSRNTHDLLTHIDQLTDLGVVGINIEDSVANNERQLVESTSFAQRISEIKQHVGDNLFINVRTDAYLLAKEHALQETLDRAAYYEQAGADGIFIPCLTDRQDIKILCDAISLPINIMSMPELDNLTVLGALGVKRVSSGNIAMTKMYQGLSDTLAEVQRTNTFNSLFK